MSQFTDRELDLMDVLWKLGSGTVTEVREHLDDDLAYNTVLSVLRTLEAKGHVRHEGEGRAHRYYATVQRAEAGKSAVSRLLDKVFDGSAEALLTHLMSDRRVTRSRLASMRALLDERLRDKEKPS